MHDTFRSFSEVFAAQEPPQLPEAPDIPQRCGCAEESLRDLRVFNARVRQGVDSAVQILLADIAAVVLARELEMRPCDIAKIVERACEHFEADGPLCVRVHPDDAAALATSCVAVVKDGGLRAGDAVLELRSGHVDASAGARLASIFPALAA